MNTVLFANVSVRPGGNIGLDIEVWKLPPGTMCRDNKDRFNHDKVFMMSGPCAAEILRNLLTTLSRYRGAFIEVESISISRIGELTHIDEYNGNAMSNLLKTLIDFHNQILTTINMK